MAKKARDPRTLSREELVLGFHQIYLENIKKETASRGKLVGISGDRLKEIFNESIADFGERLLARPTHRA